jgi:hypothetical protein
VKNLATGHHVICVNLVSFVHPHCELLH